MSRNKKSRSLKRVTGGVKTGSKERTKLENKQNKARKKASSMTGKVKRQRSVYQKMLDENASTKQDQPKKAAPKPDQEVVEPEVTEAAAPTPIKESAKEDTLETPEQSDDDLWDQLENPGETDTF